MEINGIEDIRYNGSTVDVVVAIELDEDTVSRWEIEDPLALAVYKNDENITLDYIDIIDKGMKIHGYEFTREEEDKIIDFLETHHIKRKIKEKMK